MAQYNLNWGAGDEERLGVRPGRYLAEVDIVEEATSKKGDPYLRIHFCEALGARRHICRDSLMLSGKGWGIGKRKLHALGFDEKTTVLRPSSLVGRRVYLHVVEGERDGRKFNEVDIDGSEWCGYEPEDQADHEVIEEGLSRIDDADDDEPLDPTKVPF